MPMTALPAESHRLTGLPSAHGTQAKAHSGPGCSLFIRPDFGDLATAAVATESKLTKPAQRQLALPVASGAIGNSRGLNGIGSVLERMHLDSIVGDQPELALWVVASVDHPDLVVRLRIEIGVDHLERGVIQHLRVVHPGYAARYPGVVLRLIKHQVLLEIHPRELESTRILGEPAALHQMRLAGNVAQVIIEPARPGIGPLEDFLYCFEPVGIRGELADASELFQEPLTIVERELQRIQAGTAVHCDGFVQLDTQLHANALEERFGQLEDARAPLRIGVFHQGAVEHARGFRHGAGDSDLRRLLQGRQRLHFQIRLEDEPVADVGVVIRAEERLLESPVLQNGRRRLAVPWPGIAARVTSTPAFDRSGPRQFRSRASNPWAKSSAKRSPMK